MDKHDDTVNENSPLIQQEQGSVTRLTRYRWVVLAVFSLFSLVQSAVWDTWGPISSSATKALGFTSRDYDLLSNWASIGILPFMPVCIWLLHVRGTRFTVVLGASLVVLGTGLRCLPLEPSVLKYFIHAGQLLSSIAGCPVMNAAPIISILWFPSGERITATCTMILLGNLGNAASFLIGPAMVDPPNNCTNSSGVLQPFNFINSYREGNLSHINCTDNTDEIRRQISNMLYMEFGVAVVTFILCLFLFKNKPRFPPSPSAAISRLDILSGIKALLKKGIYWVVVLSYSLITGAFYGWYGIISTIYIPMGVSQDEIGLIGFMMTVVGTVSGIIIGWFADRMKGRLKWIVFSITFLTFLSVLYLVIITLNWIPITPFKFTKVGLWISALLVGGCINAFDPLGLEFATDLAFPINEGTSSSVIMWWLFVIMFVFLTVLNSVNDQNIANYLFVTFAGLSTLLILFTPNINNRVTVDNSDPNGNNQSERDEDA